MFREDNLMYSYQSLTAVISTFADLDLDFMDIYSSISGLPQGKA